MPLARFALLVHVDLLEEKTRFEVTQAEKAATEGKGKTALAPDINHPKILEWEEP